MKQVQVLEEELIGISTENLTLAEIFELSYYIDEVFEVETELDCDQNMIILAKCYKTKGNGSNLNQVI
jgi:hypothetical protein